MSSFTKEVKLGPFDFDGDEIFVTATRLKRKDLKHVQQYLISDGAGGITADPVKSMDMIDEVAVKILPKRVILIEGFSPEADTEKALQMISDEAFYTELLAEICGDLMDKSYFKGGKESKKSGKPLASPSQEDKEDQSNLSEE